MSIEEGMRSFVVKYLDIIILRRVQTQSNSNRTCDFFGSDSSFIGMFVTVVEAMS